MNKKIPLFKKDSDIFAHIFWVTLRAATRATDHTRGSCTVAASAIKACLSLIDTEGKRDQSGDKATPERSHYNYTSKEDIITNDKAMQDNVKGRPIL